MINDINITIIFSLFSVMLGLIYFLISSVKSSLNKATDDIKTKVDSFGEALNSLKEAIAIKSTILEFVRAEVDSIKKECKACQKSKGEN